MRWQSSMLARSVAIPTLLILVAACGDHGRPTGPTGPTVGPGPAGPLEPLGPTAPNAGPTPRTDDAGIAIAPPAAEPARIAPHPGQIIATALDRTGTAAVTIDNLGDVRVWRSLDGTLAPVALPFHGARALELARDGDALVVGRIDPAGAAHFYRLDRDGRLLATGDAPAVPQAIGLVAMSADAWLIVRADHSLVLVDAHGAQLDEVVPTGLRIEALRPAGARDALAIVSHGGVGYGAVAVTVADREVTWGREHALAIAPMTPVEVATSPDGKRLVYFADPARVAAVAAAAAKPVTSRRPPGSPHQQVAPRSPVVPIQAAVVIVELATGANVTPKDLAATTVGGPQRLGFSSDDTLHVYGASSGDLTVGLDADAETVPGTLPRSGAPAIGPGLVASGADRNLLVQRDGGETRYLGYQRSTPTMAALSPDGARAAWLTGDGQILVETLDGSAPLLHLPEVASGVITLDFVDDAHLLVASQRGSLELYSTARGALVAATTAPGATYSVRLDRRTGWVLGVRDGGGVWALRVTPGAPDPWSPAHVLADGSATFWMLEGPARDDTAPAVITLDNAGDARTYTGAQLAAGVSSSKLARIAKTRIAPVPMYIDPRGRSYVFRESEIRVGASLLGASLLGATDGVDALLLTIVGPRDLMASPDGQVLIAFDQTRTAVAVGADGTTRWTIGLGAPGWRPAFSSDGRRVALISTSGGQVVDVATGAVIAARCGWEFGAFPTPPPGFGSQVHPICE